MPHGVLSSIPGALEWQDTCCVGQLLSCLDYIELGCSWIQAEGLERNCSQSVKHVNYIPVTFKKFLAPGEVLSER